MLLLSIDKTRAGMTSSTSTNNWRVHRPSRWRCRTRVAVMLAVFMTGVRMSVVFAHAEVQIHAPAGDGRFGCTAICPQGHFVQSLCVNPGGTDGCESSISAAVSQISAETVNITVAAGTYVDNVSINTERQSNSRSSQAEAAKSDDCIILDCCRDYNQRQWRRSGFHDWTQSES